MSSSQIDYHVHLTDEFSIHSAMELSRHKSVRFGIVEHPGPASGIVDDDSLLRYVENLRKYPVFVGLQPVYTGWSTMFSRSALDQLDYVLMDADTVPLGDGEYLAIWRHDNYIADLDLFMDQYMRHIVHILEQEPITIFARPTYLPVNFARYYDQLWTEQRVDTIIELAKQRNIAFEISTPMHVPKQEIIMAAKDAGLKFAFGTNARSEYAGDLHYGMRMAEECNLSADNMLVLS